MADPTQPVDLNAAQAATQIKEPWFSDVMQGLQPIAQVLAMRGRKIGGPLGLGVLGLGGVMNAYGQHQQQRAVNQAAIDALQKSDPEAAKDLLPIAQQGGDVLGALHTLFPNFAAQMKPFPIYNKATGQEKIWDPTTMGTQLPQDYVSPQFFDKTMGGSMTPFKLWYAQHPNGNYADFQRDSQRYGIQWRWTTNPEGNPTQIPYQMKPNGVLEPLPMEELPSEFGGGGGGAGGSSGGATGGTSGSPSGGGVAGPAATAGVTIGDPDTPGGTGSGPSGAAGAPGPTSTTSEPKGMYGGPLTYEGLRGKLTNDQAKQVTAINDVRYELPSLIRVTEALPPNTSTATLKAEYAKYEAKGLLGTTDPRFIDYFDAWGRVKPLLMGTRVGGLTKSQALLNTLSVHIPDPMDPPAVALRKMRGFNDDSFNAELRAVIGANYQPVPKMPGSIDTAGGAGGLSAGTGTTPSTPPFDVLPGGWQDDDGTWYVQRTDGRYYRWANNAWSPVK